MSLTEGQIKAYETEGFVPKVQISDETEATHGVRYPKSKSDP